MWTDKVLGQCKQENSKQSANKKSRESAPEVKLIIFVVLIFDNESKLTKQKRFMLF